MIQIKIAIISDVHANSVALKEVLNDAKSQGVEEYIFPGDLVNDLPFGNETMEIIGNTSKYLIIGNKEEYLKEYDKEKYKWSNIQFRNSVFIYEELSKENLNLISNLPMSLDLEFEDMKLKVVHGSPKSVTEHLHETSNDLIDKYTKDLNADILICGHTHDKIWHKYVNGKLVINAGCMGVSPYYNSKAEYVILHINNKRVDIEKRLIQYNPEDVKNKIIKCGILERDRVLMSLTYASITGNGETRYKFFKEANQAMKDINHSFYKNDAKEIFKYFKLYDDDIWIKYYNKYKSNFEF